MMPTPKQDAKPQYTTHSTSDIAIDEREIEIISSHNGDGESIIVVFKSSYLEDDTQEDT